MRARPLTPDALVEELAERVAARSPGSWLRVAVDGAPTTDPDPLAAALVDPLRVRGRAALAIPSNGFLRPASLRLEYGRQDPDTYYERWLDRPALRREVLDRVGPHGTGQVLPSLWDPQVDRATRAGYVAVPPGGVVLVSGELLLAGGLPFDLTIHLAQTAAALARRTSPEHRWRLPAYDRYRAEAAPEQTADLVVRVDDPRRPALVEAR